MVGEISTITISFAVVGVDNAMLLESITIDENRPFQIPGINFDDLHTAGFVSNDNIALEYNKTLKGTKFTVNSDGQVSHQLEYDFDVIAYKDIYLNYYYSQTGVTSVKVTLTYKNGHSGSYVFTGFASDSALQTMVLPLNEEGSLDTISLEFVGAGQIVITDIRFTFEAENACDLSSSKTFNSFLPDWAKPLSYIEDKQATMFNSPNGYARYYFGYSYKNGRRDTPNICLDGKSKIYIVYQNQKPSCGLFLNVYVVDKRTNAEYLTAVSESSPAMDNARFDLAMNMDSRSYKVASVNIPSMYCNENYYVANIGFGISYSDDSTIFLRGVVFR